MIDKNIIKKVKDFKNKYDDVKIKDMVKKPKFPEHKTRWVYPKFI